MKLKEFERKLEGVEFQGAISVAVHAAEFLIEWVDQNEFEDKKDLLNQLKNLSKEFGGIRPTEPAMRDVFSLISHKIEKSDEENMEELEKVFKNTATDIENHLKKSMGKVAAFGSHLIDEGDVVLTHCHSNTVELIFRRAAEEKDFEVINTETRPLYQGRKTSKRLLNKGIKTTMVVDSAAHYFMDKVDKVFIGADSISSSGYIVNKIGTSQIALVASKFNVPVYVAVESFKFNPATMRGEEEKIEHREPEEVWEKAPEGLRIENPAFDITPREYIKSIITEKGIYPPGEIPESFELK